jgi:hypothetical protein
LIGSLYPRLHSVEETIGKTHAADIKSKPDGGTGTEVFPVALPKAFLVRRYAEKKSGGAEIL